MHGGQMAAAWAVPWREACADEGQGGEGGKRRGEEAAGEGRPFGLGGQSVLVDAASPRPDTVACDFFSGEECDAPPSKPCALAHGNHRCITEAFPVRQSHLALRRGLCGEASPNKAISQQGQGEERGREMKKAQRTPHPIFGSTRSRFSRRPQQPLYG